MITLSVGRVWSRNKVGQKATADQSACDISERDDQLLRPSNASVTFGSTLECHDGIFAITIVGAYRVRGWMHILDSLSVSVGVPSFTVVFASPMAMPPSPNHPRINLTLPSRAISDSISGSNMKTLVRSLRFPDRQQGSVPACSTGTGTPLPRAHRTTSVRSAVSRHACCVAVFRPCIVAPDLASTFLTDTTRHRSTCRNRGDSWTNDALQEQFIKAAPHLLNTFRSPNGTPSALISDLMRSPPSASHPVGSSFREPLLLGRLGLRREPRD